MCFAEQILGDCDTAEGHVFEVQHQTTWIGRDTVVGQCIAFDDAVLQTFDVDRCAIVGIAVTGECIVPQNKVTQIA